MRVSIAVVALGQWYARGVSRLINEFQRVMPDHEYENDVDHHITVKAWVNCLPLGAPKMCMVEDFNYVGYTAKPFAMAAAMEDCDVAILADAAFFPIRDIAPLVRHIAERGYYLCDNGATVGEWSSDAALDHFALLREDAMKITEASSYCVGLSNVSHGHRDRNRQLVKQWCDSWRSFPGPHTAGEPGEAGKRNPGFVSHDPCVKGHRHDQTALSIIAHRLGLHELTTRPIFTAYDGSQDARTVLANRGL